MIPLGFVATLAGWITAESGRQPWLVYGLLRTRDAVSPISIGSVATSLALFVVVYNLLLAAYAYYIVKLFWKGPEDNALPPVQLEPIVAQRAAMPAE
jgi:cytochrome d ubiquinol oxidase subunit I